METSLYMAPPPPYTSEAPPKCSEASPLIPKSSGYPQADAGNGNNSRANKLLTISFTIVAALLTATVILAVTFLFSSLIHREPNTKPEIRVVNFKVGIIGAGPAGIAAAQGLRNEVLHHAEDLKTRDVEIQLDILIYEEKCRIGGRMSFEDGDALGIEIEDVAGGAFDGYLLDTIGGVRDEKIQDDVVAENEDFGMGKVAFFDPTRVITETYRPYSNTPWYHYLSLFMKYHTSVWRAPMIPTGTMKTINSFLHSMISANSSTHSVQEMIRIMSKQYTFVPFSISANERLEKNGIGNDYVRDILAPQVRRHTGQSIEELSDLAISMALGREEMGSQKPASSGILQMMMQNALKASEARLVSSAKVIRVRYEEVVPNFENWWVQWEDTNDEELSPSAEIFDKIIVASPLDYSEILGDMEHQSQYTNYDIPHETEYQPVYTTFFTLSSRISSFLNPKLNNPLPAQLLPIRNSDHPHDPTFDSFIELSLLRPLSYSHDSIPKTYLYRLLTSIPLSPITLTTFLSLSGSPDNPIRNWTQHAIPYAYPKMQATLSKNIQGDFRLGKDIWTTNGVEGPLGSSVELAWMVGGNVGRLVGKHLVGEGAEEQLRKGDKN